jgi:hypothetical protein
MYLRAEPSNSALQEGEGVGGDLHVGADADKGELARGRMVNPLAVERGADRAGEVPRPLREILGGAGFHPVGEFRFALRLDIGHGQVMRRQKALGVACGQSRFVFVVGGSQSEQLFYLFDDRRFVGSVCHGCSFGQQDSSTNFPGCRPGKNNPRRHPL